LQILYTYLTGRKRTLFEWLEKHFLKKSRWKKKGESLGSFGGKTFLQETAPERKEGTL